MKEPLSDRARAYAYWTVSFAAALVLVFAFGFRVTTWQGVALWVVVVAGRTAARHQERHRAAQAAQERLDRLRSEETIARTAEHAFNVDADNEHAGAGWTWDGISETGRSNYRQLTSTIVEAAIRNAGAGAHK